MKKITLLFVATVLALSCSDDDNTPISLDGTWKLTSVIMPEEWTSDENGDGIESSDFVTEYGYFDNSTITFGENNTAIFNNQHIYEGNTPTPDNVTYTTAGDSITFYYSIDTTGSSSVCTPFKQSGNKLTATLSEN